MDDVTAALHLTAVHPNFHLLAAVLPSAAGAVDAENQQHMTALTRAAAIGLLENVRMLLKAGASANGTPTSSAFPLHTAAQSGAAPVVHELVAAGGNTHTRLRGEATPLHVAVRQGRLAATEALIADGADGASRTAHAG